MALANIPLHRHHFEHNRPEQYGALVSNYFLTLFLSFFGVFHTYLGFSRKVSHDNLKVSHD